MVVESYMKFLKFFTYIVFFWYDYYRKRQGKKKTGKISVLLWEAQYIIIWKENNTPA